MWITRFKTLLKCTMAVNPTNILTNIPSKGHKTSYQPCAVLFALSPLSFCLVKCPLRCRQSLKVCTCSSDSSEWSPLASTRTIVELPNLLASDTSFTPFEHTQFCKAGVGSCHARAALHHLGHLLVPASGVSILSIHWPTHALVP